MSHAPQTDLFRRWIRDPQAEEYGLPVFYLSRDAVQQALGASFSLVGAARAIDRDAAPHSQALADLKVTAVDRTAKVRRPVRNVVGILRGSDTSLQSEFVVVGAHYDHLGRSARFSMSPNSTGQIHHGADDNASGTAAVMEMAKAAAEARTEFKRSIVFMTFAGEELGLLGSSYYVEHPLVPLEKTVAMINLDMVGRAGGRILVDGIANAPSIDDDLKVAQKSSGISLTALKGSPGAGASDDASFSLRKIPRSISFRDSTRTTTAPPTRGTRSTRRAAPRWRTSRWRWRAKSPTAQPGPNSSRPSRNSTAALEHGGRRLRLRAVFRIGAGFCG